MKKIFYIMLLILVVSSCRKKDGDLTWNNQVLAPLFSSTLTLQNISPLNKFDTAKDGLLTLIREQEIVNYSMADLFQIPDTEVVNTITIDSLKLGDRAIEQKITLEQVFPQASLLNGQMFPVPANDLNNLPPFNVDGSGLFETATFVQGMLDISIGNGFPVELELLEFVLRDKNTLEVIIQDQFTNIIPNSIESKSVDLSGKTVTKDMEILISRLKTAASSGPVLINKNDAVKVSIIVSNSRVSKATAIFPSQSLFTKNENTEYFFDGAELKKIKIKSGILRMRVVSTIEENMTISYTIPHADLNGNNISQILNVPAAAPSTNSTVFKDFDLSGYELDLRGKNPVLDEEYNQFYSELDVRIDSSGKIRTITLQDSVYIYYGLLDLIPEKATGYFGHKTIADEKNEINFDLFKDVNGEIKLDDIIMFLNLENGFGMGDRNLTLGLKELTSKNTKTGNNVTLNTANVMANPTEVFTAVDNPFKISKLSLQFNKYSSNLIPFFENLGDKIYYDVNVNINPEHNKNYNQFAYDVSTLKATLNIQVPMNIAVRNFGLTQFTKFDFTNQENSDRIKEGVLYFVCNNGFPLEMKMQVYLLDKNENVIDSLMGETENIMQAAVPSAPGQKIIEQKQSVLKCNIDEYRLKLLKENPKVKIQFGISTPNFAEKTKFYDSYKININVTGKFKYAQQIN